MLRQVHGFCLLFSRALETAHVTSETGVLLDGGQGPGFGMPTGWGDGGTDQRG